MIHRRRVQKQSMRFSHVCKIAVQAFGSSGLFASCAWTVASDEVKLGSSSLS
jgi:hypothetical protein